METAEDLSSLLKTAENQIQSHDSTFLKTLEKVHQHSSLDAQILLKVGKLYASCSESAAVQDLACQIFDEVLALDPNCFEALIFWGRALMCRSQLDENEGLLVKAIQKIEVASKLSNLKEEEEALCYHVWAEALSLLYDHSQEVYDLRIATSYLKKAQKFGLSTVSFYLLYGKVLEKLGKSLRKWEWNELAVSYYQKAADLAPHSSNVWSALASAQSFLFFQGYSAYFFEEAAQSYVKELSVVKEDEDKAHVLLEWGKLLQRAGVFYQKSGLISLAIDKLEAAASLSEEEEIQLCLFDARIRFASLEENLTLLKQVEKSVQEKLSKSPDDPNVWYFSGRVQQALAAYFNEVSHLEGALEKYSQGLTLDPTHARSLYGKAKVMTDFGEELESQACFEEALEFFAEAAKHEELLTPHFWNDWGVAYLGLSEKEGNAGLLRTSITCFEHALEFYKKEEYQNVEILYNYGCALDFLGDSSEDPDFYESAMEVFLKVLEIDPKHTHARYHYALSLSHFGEMVDDPELLEQACDQFEGIVLTSPEDGTAWGDWGTALMMLADMRKDPLLPQSHFHYLEHAEYKLQKSLQLGHQPVHYYLACLYCLTGRYADAFDQLHRARQCGSLPSLEEIEEDEWLSQLRSLPEYVIFRTMVN